MQVDPLIAKRAEFWPWYLEQDPDSGAVPYRDSNAFIPLAADGTVGLTLGISQSGATVFLRAAPGTKGDLAGAVLAPHLAALHKKLHVAPGPEGGPNDRRYFRHVGKKLDYALSSHWPRIADYFQRSRLRYAAAIKDVLEGKA